MQPIPNSTLLKFSGVENYDPHSPSFNLNPPSIHHLSLYSNLSLPHIIFVPVLLSLSFHYHTTSSSNMSLTPPSSNSPDPFPLNLIFTQAPDRPAFPSNLPLSLDRVTPSTLLNSRAPYTAALPSSSVSPFPLL